ncbi:sulfotransferase [Pelagibius sp.]|uniref:sulfotransferase n=1 Tax=Pelagibius sp. TaxID=1931238 RepID=UPI0026340945|nr:sulfotransferase [Pelagibius sp.]
MARRYRIAYVVGLPYSGSTLLAHLLNAHPRAFSVGDVLDIHGYANLLIAKSDRNPSGSACGCGAESIWSCEFWREVDGEIERRAGLTLRDLDVMSSDPLRFADHNRLLFDSVADVSGARLIVDSSKALSRLTALLTCTELPVVPIHLMRNPKGQICAALKSGGASVLKTATHYRRATLMTLRVLRETEHLRLRYEDLILDPQGALTAVMRPLGLEFRAAQLDWASAERHGLSGNQLPRPAEGRRRVQEEWRQMLGLSRQALITMLTLPAIYATRRY